MPRESRPSIQQELDAKLRQLQALVGEAISLVGRLHSRAAPLSIPAQRTASVNSSVRFDMNERAFIKRYVKNVGGGAKKFVLRLAFLTKGDGSKEVPVSDIEQLWSRTKSKALLGLRFNRKFPTTAKEHGWVDSRTRGLYNLDRSWKDVLVND